MAAAWVESDSSCMSNVISDEEDCDIGPFRGQTEQILISMIWGSRWESNVHISEHRVGNIETNVEKNIQCKDWIFRSPNPDLIEIVEELEKK
jgi:hypothetical protein